MTFSIVLLVIFFAVMIGIGVWGMKKTTSLNDFFLGGRTIGPWISALAYGTTYFSAVAFVGFAGYLSGTPVGKALLIEDFKINMPIVAALLTIIGYSVNDKIVLFDRIRELRGRLGQVSSEMVNDAINQCMSRTILTGGAVLVVLIILYIWGGSSIRGFNYCMFIGVVGGTYSSISIATMIVLLQLSRRRSGALSAPRSA